ncbi:hypothetical protein AIOL_004253 [Candidatus Rhodobacter oscarellae]|uniref:Uncharacterized protein n=1 Tax=Candidatus Rhodobacter oscarellae TaxID=1675527 RepID=A0A0J9E901_9RHOB|nr:DUF6882 domain-containing protein [Candidatus Rhodobacter lobularis]KMW59272.1 hypothetical protein AIOL_004253 [Candidatus Rhodobacter lobularis]
MNGVLLEFAGRMADQGATMLPESYAQLVANAQLFLGPRMSGACKVLDFRLNLRKGRVVLAYEDGGEAAADAQVIGTYANDGSFMWGWGHPEVPEPMQAAAWAVQQFGDRQEIDALLTRGGPTDAARLAEYQAICAYISDADGVFIGDHGGGGQIAFCYYFGDQIKKAMQV